MATEYKLSYTASEIDRMLGEVDKPKSWNDLTDKPFGVKVIESDIMLDTITVETVADENGNYCSENFAFASEPETTGEEVITNAIYWGAFIQAVIDFLLTAVILFAIFKIFTVVTNTVKKMQKIV